MKNGRATVAQRTRPQRLGNLLLVGAAALVCVVLGEAALRLSGQSAYQPYVIVSSPFIRADAHLGWANLEGYSGNTERNGSPIFAQHNSFGARGPDYSAAPATGVRRVLLLGDSYAWGYGVDQWQTASAMMDRQDPALEVINMGVNGYSTDQQLLLFEKMGPTLRADIVVLLAFSNDMMGNTVAANFASRPKPHFILRQGELELRPRAPLGVGGTIHVAGTSHSALYQTAAFTLRTARVFPFPLIRSGAHEAAAAWHDEPIAAPDPLMAALISRLRAAIENTGGALVVVAAVNQGQIQKNTDAAFRETLARICLELAIPYLDISPSFQQELRRNPEARLRLEHDDHWNARAHQVVASAMHEFLAASGLIP